MESDFTESFQPSRSEKFSFLISPAAINLLHYLRNFSRLKGNALIREILMIIFVTCSTLGSQLLVKRAVTQIAARDTVPQGAQWLIAACLSPEVLAAVAIQGIGFIVWVVVVSRVKLGLAFAISGSFFYVLIALASWMFYGERLGPLQWIGLILVSGGVLLMTLPGKLA